MKNNFYKFFIYFILFIIFINNSNAEQFKFNITEIEIAENGNLIIGSKMEKLKHLMVMK